MGTVFSYECVACCCFKERAWEKERNHGSLISRDLPLAKEPSSKRANRALPCFFQRFYKCYRCLGPTGPTQVAGVRGERGLASRVRAAVRVTPRRAPSRPTSSTTAANRRVSSAPTAASLARRSSTSRITLGTSTRRSRSSATRSSRTSRAAGYGANERRLPLEHRFNACDPPPRKFPAFPFPWPDRPAKIDRRRISSLFWIFVPGTARDPETERRPFCTCVLCNRWILYMYKIYNIIFILTIPRWFEHRVRVEEKTLVFSEMLKQRFGEISF